MTIRCVFLAVAVVVLCTAVTQTNAQDTREKDLAELIKRIRDHYESATDRVDALEKELEAQKSENGKTRARHAENIEKLTAGITDLETEVQALTDTLNNTTHSLVKEKKLHVQLEKELEDEKAQHKQTKVLNVEKEQTFTTRIIGLQKSTRDSAIALENTRRDLSQRDKENNILKEIVEQRQIQLEKRFREFEKVSTAATANIEKLNKELKDEKVQHEQTQARGAKQQETLTSRIDDLDKGVEAAVKALENSLLSIEKQEKRHKDLEKKREKLHEEVKAAYSETRQGTYIPHRQAEQDKESVRNHRKSTQNRQTHDRKDG